MLTLIYFIHYWYIFSCSIFYKKKKNWHKITIKRVNESMFLQNSFATVQYLPILRKKADKKKVIRIKWISKDFRCNIERESAGISYLAAGILICLSSCLSNTSEPLGSFCSVSLPLFFRESMSQATAIREGNHIPSHCPSSTKISLQLLTEWPKPGPCLHGMSITPSNFYFS